MVVLTRRFGAERVAGGVGGRTASPGDTCPVRGCVVGTGVAVTGVAVDGVRRGRTGGRDARRSGGRHRRGSRLRRCSSPGSACSRSCSASCDGLVIAW